MNRKVQKSPVYTIERGREATLLVRQGWNKNRVWKKLFPSSKANSESSTTLCNRLLRWYMNAHPSDFNEQLVINDLGVDRALRELDERLKATTTKEMTRVEYVTFLGANGVKGKKKEYKRPVMVRETKEVEDNTTRMTATKTLLELHDLLSTQQDGPKVQVIIFNAQQMNKPDGSGE